MSALLSIRHLVKSFGGLMAVSDVSFDVAENSVVGLIGPNGAGKTTVFNLITGNYRPNSGSITFELPLKICDILLLQADKEAKEAFEKAFQEHRANTFVRLAFDWYMEHGLPFPKINK